jgi:hypothetical protein
MVEVPGPRGQMALDVEEVMQLVVHGVNRCAGRYGEGVELAIEDRLPGARAP